MEICLNLAWVLLAAAMFGAWLRRFPLSSKDSRRQLIALAVLLLILFPVISVTDDLQTAQNPAETDCCQRRNQICAHVHPSFVALASSPVPANSAFAIGFQRMAVGRASAEPSFDDPALSPVQNRPPPAC
jgi:hypothetical protein